MLKLRKKLKIIFRYENFQFLESFLKFGYPLAIINLLQSL
jgi:hypothetical protein